MHRLAGLRGNEPSFADLAKVLRRRNQVHIEKHKAAAFRHLVFGRQSTNDHDGPIALHVDAKYLALSLTVAFSLWRFGPASGRFAVFFKGPLQFTLESRGLGDEVPPIAFEPVKRQLAVCCSVGSTPARDAFSATALYALKSSLGVDPVD